MKGRRTEREERRERELALVSKMRKDSFFLNQIIIIIINF